MANDPHCSFDKALAAGRIKGIRSDGIFPVSENLARALFFAGEEAFARECKTMNGIYIHARRPTKTKTEVVVAMTMDGVIEGESFIDVSEVDPYLDSDVPEIHPISVGDFFSCAFKGVHALIDRYGWGKPNYVRLRNLRIALSLYAGYEGVRQGDIVSVDPFYAAKFDGLVDVPFSPILSRAMFHAARLVEPETVSIKSYDTCGCIGVRWTTRDMRGGRFVPVRFENAYQYLSDCIKHSVTIMNNQTDQDEKELDARKVIALGEALDMYKRLSNVDVCPYEVKQWGSLPSCAATRTAASARTTGSPGPASRRTWRASARSPWASR